MKSKRSDLDSALDEDLTKQIIQKERKRYKSTKYAVLKVAAYNFWEHYLKEGDLLFAKLSEKR